MSAKRLVLMTLYALALMQGRRGPFEIKFGPRDGVYLG